MRLITLIGLIAFSAFTSSCMNVRMYEGPERSADELGRFFTPGRRNLRVDAVDQKPLGFVGTNVLQLAPGVHIFDIYASNYQVSGYFAPGAGVVITKESDSYDEGMYRIELAVRAGYTYVIDYPNNFSGPLPEKICVRGEPHRATGSAEDFYRGTRTMSAGAEIAACGSVSSQKEVRR